jgi:bifunctional non-homologous end joining protein LigD
MVPRPRATASSSRRSSRRCCSPRALPTGDAWTIELKWDGCRAQLRYDGKAVSVRIRNGRECSADFPELVAIAEALGKRQVTLDGELVCLSSDGQPDFARLRRRLTGSAIHRHLAMLQVFDLLHLDGHSTRSRSYAERRALLEELALSTGRPGAHRRGSCSTEPTISSQVSSSSVQRESWPSSLPRPTSRGAGARRGSSTN